MIGCSTKGMVAVIDPQIKIKQYIQSAEQYGLRITHILETHVQADHYSGAKELSQTCGAPVYFHELAPISFPHQGLNDSDTITIGNRHLRVIHTPGHTDDSICLLIDDWFILTGDTLLVGDVGRVDLSLGDNPIESEKRAKQLYQSIMCKLLVLPDYLELFPGHFGGSSCGKNIDGKPSTTIGYEKRTNRMLRIPTEKMFVEEILSDVPPPPAEYRTIKKVNLA